MTVIHKHKRQASPRSTRELRADVVDLAASLVGTPDKAELVISGARLSAETIQREWERLIKAFSPDVQARLTLAPLEMELGSRVQNPPSKPDDAVPLELVNFRYEIVRQLIEADIGGAEPQSVEALATKVGASHFTVRKILAGMVRLGIVKQSSPTHARFSLVATEVDLPLLGALQALPQTLRFSYARGAHPRSTEELISRFEMLMQLDMPKGWENVGLSGTAATNPLRLPSVDLLGVPRIDLTAYVGRDTRDFSVSVLNLLDDGLEYVPDLRTPAAVVITVVQSPMQHNHPTGVAPWRYAQNSDIYLALLDAGLREQALQFARNGGKSPLIGGKSPLI